MNDDQARTSPDVSIEALTASFFRCDASWTLPTRTRPHYQLWLITGGSVVLTIQGGHPLQLAAQSALLIAPGAGQCARHDPSNPLRCYVTHFTCRVYGAPAVMLWPTEAVVDIPALRWRQVVNCADDMIAELKESRPGAQLLANAATTKLLGLLQRSRIDSQVHQLHAEGSLSEVVSTTLAHIRRHYDQDLTLRELAESAHVSDAYLGHIFRDAVGLSPLQYLQRHRIDRAKSLLIESNLAINQISTRVGFRDPYYFSRVFRRLEATSPLSYRQAQRSGDSF